MIFLTTEIDSSSTRLLPREKIALLYPAVYQFLVHVEIDVGLSRGDNLAPSHVAKCTGLRSMYVPMVQKILVETTTGRCQIEKYTYLYGSLPKIFTGIFFPVDTIFVLETGIFNNVEYSLSTMHEII